MEELDINRLGFSQLHLSSSHSGSKNSHEDTIGVQDILIEEEEEAKSEEDKALEEWKDTSNIITLQFKAPLPRKKTS